jgi:hypothetical protein
MTAALIALGLLIIVGLSYAKVEKSPLKMQSAEAYEPGSATSEAGLSYSIASITLRLAIASGIIALMTIKPPDFSGVIAIEVLFVIIGYIWVLHKRF